jgi:hypothetical protein
MSGRSVWTEDHVKSLAGEPWRKDVRSIGNRGPIEALPGLTKYVRSIGITAGRRRGDRSGRDVRKYVRNIGNPPSNSGVGRLEEAEKGRSWGFFGRTRGLAPEGDGDAIERTMSGVSLVDGCL